MIASVMAFMTAFVMAFVTTFQLAWPTCVAVVKQRNSSGIYAFSVKRHGLAKSSLFSNASAQYNPLGNKKYTLYGILRHLSCHLGH